MVVTAYELKQKLSIDEIAKSYMEEGDQLPPLMPTSVKPHGWLHLWIHNKLASVIDDVSSVNQSVIPGWILSFIKKVQTPYSQQPITPFEQAQKFIPTDIISMLYYVTMKL